MADYKCILFQTCSNTVFFHLELHNTADFSFHHIFSAADDGRGELSAEIAQSDRSLEEKLSKAVNVICTSNTRTTLRNVYDR